MIYDKEQKHHAVDSKIALRYTGIDKDHLKFIREQCVHCNPGAEVSTMTHRDTLPAIYGYLMASYALKLGAYLYTNVISRPTTDCHSGSTDFEIIACPPSLQTRCNSVIWIGRKGTSAEPIPTQMLRPSHVSAANSTLVPSYFLHGEAEQLQTIVGLSFLHMDRGHVDAHQSIIIASFLADHRGIELEVGTGTWLQQQFRHDRPLLGSNTLLLLAWHRYDPKDRTVQETCAHMANKRPGDVRMFSSAEELEYLQQKNGDIRVLDQIAKCAPGRWSFRPVTCDSTSGCHLYANSVLKRTHSCGSEHVIVHPTATDFCKHPPCQSRKGRMNTRQAYQSAGRWFHQEFVPVSRSEGEYRVFIITRSDVSVLRQRRGVVMEMEHMLELPDKELVVTVLRLDSMLRDGPRVLNNKDLEELAEFAMYVFNALRNRSD